MNVIWAAISMVLTRCFSVYGTAQRQRSDMQTLVSNQLYDKMQTSQEGVVVQIMEEMCAQQYRQMVLAYMMLILKSKSLTLEELDDDCEEFLVGGSCLGWGGSWQGRVGVGWQSGSRGDHSMGGGVGSRHTFRERLLTPAGIAACSLSTRFLCTPRSLCTLLPASTPPAQPRPPSCWLAGWLTVQVRDFDQKIDFQVEAALPRLISWGLVKKTPAGRLEAMPIAEAISTLQGEWATAYHAMGSARKAPTAELIAGTTSTFGSGKKALADKVGERGVKDERKWSGFGLFRNACMLRVCMHGWIQDDMCGAEC